MPTVARVQVILKHVSGLPRDNVSNTFWFLGNVDTQAEAEALAEAVRNFYTSDLGGATIGSVMQFLSSSVATVGHEIKVSPIDVETGEDVRGQGFPPLWTEVFDLVGRAAPGNSLPSEVACCLSYKNMVSGSVPPARRRGRAYFGPLTQAAAEMVGGVPRPTQLLRDTLVEFGKLLEDYAAGAATPWVVYSRPYEGRAEVPRPGNPRGPLPALPARPGATYAVNHVWVDNSFDTIRKRGERATARTTADVS